jgi:hypothetical protein
MDRSAAKSVHNRVFDDAATLAMGAAFDLACVSLRGFSRDYDVREAVATQIIEQPQTASVIRRSSIRRRSWPFALTTFRRPRSPSDE